MIRFCVILKFQLFEKGKEWAEDVQPLHFILKKVAGKAGQERCHSRFMIAPGFQGTGLCKYTNEKSTYNKNGVKTK
jgi:hypothetical protein